MLVTIYVVSLDILMLARVSQVKGALNVMTESGPCFQRMYTVYKRSYTENIQDISASAG